MPPNNKPIPRTKSQRLPGATGPAPVWPTDRPLGEFFLLHEEPSGVEGGEFETFAQVKEVVKKAADHQRMSASRMGKGLGSWGVEGGSWGVEGGGWGDEGGNGGGGGGEGDGVEGGFGVEGAQRGGGGRGLGPAGRNALRRRRSGRMMGKGSGYHADVADHRDWDIRWLEDSWNHQHLPEGLNDKHFQHLLHNKTLPSALHLGDGNLFLWPVEDQGQYQSCTANAVIGMAEFLLRRDQKIRCDLSRFFLYKNTRKLLGWSGDTGAYLRDTIRALKQFGAPPEEYWPYVRGFLDEEPSGFAYQYAKDFCASAYLRLDSPTHGGVATLEIMKKALADGFPVAFGFPLYRSMALLDPKALIPRADYYEFDEPVGGHAVLCVGYDESIEVPVRRRVKGSGKWENAVSDEGVLIIRNSWGRGWGDLGFAYLPCSYVTDGLATDFWALLGEKNPAP